MLSRCCGLLSLADDKELGGEDTKKQYFLKLEYLFLLDLPMLHVLWNCPYRYISLKNLVTLNIIDCDKLVRLFSVNAARELVNLQTLTIQICMSLKEVIWDEDDGDIADEDEGDIDMVVFRCLVKIELIYLFSLKSFYAGKVKISYPSLEKVEIYGCGVRDKWDKNGTYDTPNLKLVNQLSPPINHQDGVTISMRMGVPIDAEFAATYFDQVEQAVGLRECPRLKQPHQYKKVQEN